MENEMESRLIDAIDRLANAAGALQQAAERFAAQHSELSAAAESTPDATLARVVATVESDLGLKLAAAEARIAELEARATQETAPAGRKTVAAANLAAKHGVAVDGINAGAIDAALTHLSIEQRIAVKAELLRAGLLG